uniref:Protein prune homolog 2 n=1 Tax=Culex pipiens TaxID=7175 RepID=A0A8D8KQ05_CULPI
MSQNLEDSPVSDNKMDISETTTSQDSPDHCYSPDVEECGIGYPSIRRVDGHTSSNDIIYAAESIAAPSNANHSKEEYLDNQSSGGPPTLNVKAAAANRGPNSGLTPVSSHPLMLMSPTGSESDSSELANLASKNHDKVRNYYHFPDVVPASEKPPLRLANPYPNRTTTTTTTRTTTSSTTRTTTSTLDVINNIDNANNVKKPGLLRDASPDFLSSGSEQDLSQFQASVTPTFQSVALVQSQSGSQLQQQQSFEHKSISPRLHERRNVPLSTDLLVDDISSLEETVSNHSVDDLQQNLVSLSPSSSILDDNGFNVDIDDDFLEVPGTPKNGAGSGSAPQLPQYSARDEARDIRNWQKITLPDGKTREIDMKVIEPYKRVLSHGGYLQAGGHNAIVVFSACHLPDRSRADYHYVMNNLFLYVVKTLEQLVTEDYVLVYLHGGSSRNNVPPFPWLKKCYQLLDRRLRKSLKNLYMVHPTFWLKSVVWMARPFISSKFWRKLVYVKTLEELYQLVPVERAAVPDKVKNYDCRHS